MEKLILTIDDKSTEYSIPTSWDEVNVDQFAKIYGLSQEGLTMIEYFAEVLSILMEIDVDDIMMMDSESFNMLSGKVEFIQNELKANEVDYVTVEGTKYYLKKDYGSLNMGEIISIEKLMEKHGQDLGTAMSDLLCIFLRKKKDNGKLENFKSSFMGRSEMFGKITVTDIYNVMLFFSNGEISSEENMKDYLVSPKKK